ncbi:hypothetical protein sos41_24130 [Alphaproteobacteria bacterium SO-S41]|nr:hypothetical protein sos41_24130 [Alphaproteobacteria bacterium SO-S41]
MRSFLSGLMAGGAAAALLATTATATDWPAPQPLNTYGHTGLLEMPSARMMQDGEFALTVAQGPHAFRTALSFQVFPWLEAAFRYSRIDSYFLPSEGDKDLLDRSFSLKLHLVEESEYIPAISLGFQDLIGTGIYGGEYIVASKAFGDFDVTLGLGWGRLGSAGTFENPFSLISDRFKDRPRFDPGNDKGGRPLFNSIFRGENVALFGGVVWQTPIDGLQAIVEYSGDKYIDESERGVFTPESQFNFGLAYRFDTLLEASASYLYGNTFSFRLTVRFDPTTEMMKVFDKPPIPPSVRPEDQRPRTAVRGVPGKDVPVVDLTGLRGIRYASASSEWSLTDYAAAGNALVAQAADAPASNSMQDIMTSGRWYDVPAIREQIIGGLKNLANDQSLGLQAIDLKANYVSVYYENDRYVRETDAIHRMLRVLTTLPPSVEYFYLTSMVEGYPSTEVLVSRTAYERAVQQFAATDDLLEYVRIAPGGMDIPADAVRFDDNYPKFDWSITPQPRTLVFDPDEPFRFGLAIKAEATVRFGDGWMVQGAVSGDLIDTVKNPEPGKSVLPHVRTDFRLYRDEGQYGLESLIVQKTGKLSPETFYQVKAGYIEDMFGGVGGEVVWRPQGKDWALGADLYYLKQRDFNRQLGFRDYDVVTGHVSLYWQNVGWRGLNVNLHVGRYLAGDYGATIEITRKFDSGIEIGAFATLTDVPFEDFGEGSFDKGLIIRVPFGWLAPFNTKYETSTYLSSLVRDGGQRLYDVNPLWNELRDTSEAEIRRTWPLDVTPGL